MLPRTLRPAIILARGRPHGHRLRYLAGCRCAECKRVNTQYEIGRARARKNGQWNGVTDAAAAMAHIKKLSIAGVGYKVVADAAGVPSSIVFGIRSGRRPRARAGTIRKILAVTIECKADHALVSAASSWRRIQELFEEGFTSAFLAEQLGYKNRGLQFRQEKITVKNRARIERLHTNLMK